MTNKILKSRTLGLLTLSVIGLLSPRSAMAVLPQIDGPMVHVGVFFDGSAVQLTAPTESDLPLINHGESYDAPADVLDDMAFSSQYGFLPSAAFVPPANTGVWIEAVAMSAGLEAYEGGMRTMLASHTFAPMFGTDGSPANWQWNGNMHHPWFAAASPGDYQATFKVYIGDHAGAELGQYASDLVTLTWSVVPEPASITLLAASCLAVVRRRPGKVG